MLCVPSARHLFGTASLASSALSASAELLVLFLVTSLVLSCLDYGSVNLIGISRCLQDHLQSLLYCLMQQQEARLVCNGWKYDHITPLLRDLHWLRIPECIAFCLAVLVFRCHNSTALEYLARDLQWAVDDNSRKRLRSASSHKLVVRRSRLKTIECSEWLHLESGTAYLLTSPLHSLHRPSTSFPTVIYLTVLVFCDLSLKLRQAKFVIIIIIILLKASMVLFFYRLASS